MNWLDDHISQKSNVIPLLLTFLSFKRKYLLRVLEIWNGLRRLFTENLKEGMEWPGIVWIIGIPGRGLIDQKPIVVILWSDLVNVEIGQQIS